MAKYHRRPVCIAVFVNSYDGATVELNEILPVHLSNYWRPVLRLELQAFIR
jgi:hypothetical protein